MKSFVLYVVFVASLFFSIFATVSSVFAQSSIGTSIAVIDVQYLMSDSKSAKSVQEQLKSKRDELQSEFLALEKDLRDEQKIIAEKKASLSPEEFKKQRDLFEQKLLESRKIVQRKKHALDLGVKESVQKIEKEISKIVQAIATEKGYDLVLTRNNVFIGSKELDISEDVMARLNENLSKVKLKVNK